jgi:hypothetical protein
VQITDGSGKMPPLLDQATLGMQKMWGGAFLSRRIHPQQRIREIVYQTFDWDRGGSKLRNLPS